MGMFESEKEVSVLSSVYGEENLAKEQARYEHLATKFKECFGEGEVDFFSAPGRTEILGNHTDHNHGKVLTASIAMDTIAAARKNGTSLVHVISEGYKAITIDLENLDSECKCKGTLSLLIGMFECAMKKGYKVEGFDAYITTEVIGAAGVSSSASFEMLICAIMNYFSNEGKIDYVEYAKIGQYAENRYFGKGSGLMDQMVSSVGGFVYIDFADVENPKIQQHNLDFEHAGYHICITDTKGSHADLTEDYVSIPQEMKQVAEQFGKQYLREVEPAEFFDAIPKLHGVCSDRAIMRAVHFFDENRRALLENNALAADNLDFFFELIRQSGDSSANLLQNLYSCRKPTEQGIPFGIMMSKRFLGKSGAVRVHGGGFAGTIQAFVPTKVTEDYVKEMEALFGAGSCYVLRIRPVGGFSFQA